jgi:uncharacterized protein (TIGR03086 family)
VVLDGELTVEMAASMAITAKVIGAVADEDLSRPTPCGDFDVGGLLDHLMGVLIVAERAGRKAPPADAVVLHADRMDSGWRGTFTQLSTAAELAWATPQAWHGETLLLGRTFRAAAAGRKLLGELVVHGWDVARATGQAYEPDEAAVLAVHQYFAHTLAAGRSPGAWGPEVLVPEDAPLLDRVLGLSGRDPSWGR